jgi:Pyruvate/2-oxoacid:ferredoxin oxidoreductase delta subunit
VQDQELAFHYVCTLGEAREIVRQHDRFWMSNCGCRESRGREGRGRCQRSRMDVCLLFTPDFPPTGSGFREIHMADVETIFREAEDKHLVTRPFRNEEDRTKADGICFCCDDCCGYFLDPAEPCDKGTLIERTDLDQCSDCGTCVEVCYFRARRLVDGSLAIDRGNCYGCGLCVDVCPQDCIQMARRS